MNQQVKTTHLQSKTVRYPRSKFATRVTATDKREHACSGRWPVHFLRDDRKNNLRTKTKSKNKKRQTCAPGVHVDDRSVNSRPNSEGVNKTVNTPGVKRDFSAYASPQIHFISSCCTLRPSTTRKKPPTPATRRTAPEAQDSHALTPFPPCGGSVTNDSPTPRQGGGLTHAPLRAWDPNTTAQKNRRDTPRLW